MSKYSSNLISNNYNYNIDKLNFTKIKKELETIPKIIKNHNKIGLKPCFSMTDLHNNNNNNNNNMNDLNDQKYFEQNQNKTNYTPKTLSYKKSSSFRNIQNIYNNNINEKIDINSSFNDDIIIQIKKENNKEINKIKSLYELKIREISLFYETKFCDLNKLLNNNLNEYKLLSSNYISLAQHKTIINDIKKNYNELLNKTKENCEKVIKKLTDIMKNKTKYKDLIKRLQLYTIYEVKINDIEKIIINNLNEKLNNNIKGNNYFNDFYLISQLDEDINYHKKICQMNQLYNEKMTEIKLNQNIKFDNLIKYVKNCFDNKIYLYENNIINNDKKENLKLSSNIIKNINQPCYKESDNKINSYSSKSYENNNHSSSKEIDKLLNIPDSFENRLKPEVKEIKIFGKK